MAQSIVLGSTSFSTGQRVFLIDGLPADSESFELVLGIGPNWRSKSGPLFTVFVEIATGGSGFQPWATFTAQGGNVLTPTGQQLDAFSIRATWPGENDGNGGRRKLRATDLRVTITVLQPFTAESVIFRTI